MGAVHTVRALANFLVPTGRLVASGNRLVEDNTQTHGDSIGQLQRCINDLYEIWKPPPPIWDAWPDDYTNATGTQTDIGRYRIPAEHVGTGSGNEALIFNFRANVSGGATGQIEVTINDTVNLHQNTTNITGASATEHTSAALSFDDGQNDPFVTVRGRISSGTGTLTVSSIRADWVNDDTTLDDGPYENGFVPSRIDTGALHEPVSVERLQRMVNGLLVLGRTRSPGMIISKFAKNELVKTPTAQSVYARALARQPPRCTEAKVWVRGRTTVASTEQHVQAVISDNQVTIGPFRNVSAGSEEWRSGIVNLPYHDGTRSIKHEFRVVSGDANLSVKAVCAWMRPIQL